MHDADDGLHICDGGGCEEGLAVGMLQECAALLFEAVECRWIVRVVVESWGIDGAVARSSRTEMDRCRRLMTKRAISRDYIVVFSTVRGSTTRKGDRGLQVNPLILTCAALYFRYNSL